MVIKRKQTEKSLKNFLPKHAVVMARSANKMTQGELPKNPKMQNTGADSLEKITADLMADGGCKRCKLCKQRKTIVVGEGNPHAELVFVGEGPGEQEDIQGRPFVGRAGQLLDKMIEAMGLKREQIYIANVVKCRPPGNRNPEPDEISSCSPFLHRQLDAIKPKIIVALGKFSAQTLLQTETRISELRGHFHPYRGTKLMPTFHPAYLLRNPPAKKRLGKIFSLSRKNWGSQFQNVRNRRLDSRRYHEEKTIMEILSGGFMFLVILAAVIIFASVKVLNEYERGVIFTLGRISAAKGPGNDFAFPGFPTDGARGFANDHSRHSATGRDHSRQRDDQSERGGLLPRCRPQSRSVEVENYLLATSKLAQTTLRSVLGQVELDELLASRDTINHRLQTILDTQTEPWGVKVSNVEVKQIDLPVEMQRAMARQAEAERERRAKIIAAEGEMQASQKLAEAAQVMEVRPMSLQLRYLQTLSEMSSEHTSTIVIPFPIELMKAFVDRK